MENRADGKPMSLRKRIRKVFRPFLHTGDKGLDELLILDSAIPKDVHQIYVEMVNAKKWRYKFLIRRYDSFLSSLEAHNDQVRKILERVDAESLKDLYGKANLVSDDKAKSLLSLTSEANKFRITDENPYRAKIEGLHLFAAHIEDIRKQWQWWTSLRKIAHDIAIYEGYIRKSEASRINDEDTRVRAEVSMIRRPFYNFASFAPVRDLISKHNEAVLASLASDHLFDDIGGVSLDKQQRKAAVTQENTTLVIAGAGSGKTTTICGRVKFLLQRENARPEDILLLSYSKKSADDLALKMSKIDPALTVGTFHKIGLDILNDSSGRKLVVEEQWDAIIEEYFRVEMVKNIDALRDVLTYYALFLNDDESTKKYENEGELFADLKKDDFITLKESLTKLSNDKAGLETIKKERVKSYEELAIANFYFINGVDYQYERAYEIDVSSPDHRQYTPDFYLKEYGIYHEHFGLDENGRAKQFDGQAEREYLQGVLWKRQCHQNHGTKLIETYSSQFSNGTIFDRLASELKGRGVKLNPIDDEVVKDALESIYGGQSFKSFINLIKSFLSLYKARYESEDAFTKLRSFEHASPYSRKRADLFLTICESVYAFYMRRIRSEGKIDFDDMILQSMKALPGMDGYRYKYVIVDEFQDISYSRMLFLKEIIRHGGSSLFAVGDDWQSIYRFSGCDVNILLDFEDYFGLHEKYFIGNVHRNSQELQDIAKRFVEANPEQIQKQIKSDKHLSQPIKVIYYQDGDEYSSLKKTFGVIAKTKKDANVLLLGRNNKDIEPYCCSRFGLDRKTGKPVSLDFPELNLSYSTVHGSKGLEEDYVILLSAKDSNNGFPNKTEDDPLLDMVMSAPSLYPFAEERRLWYVALTRTRTYTFILAPANKSSEFLEEMEDDIAEANPQIKDDGSSHVFCPRCKGGHLVLRQKDGRQFYGCSNYPYCKYSIDDLRAVKRNKRCPLCGDFMIFKKGKFGAFFGCHSYPKCRYTEPYDDSD